MIIRNFQNVGIWDPNIKTEEIIIKNLIRDKDLISDDYELMVLPLAHMINTAGVGNVKHFINNIQSDKKRIFICQHIFVNQLNFRETDLVFSPHSSINDRFITIPHHAVSIDKNLISENKEYLFSFLGSVTTHPVRQKLVQFYPENCFNSNVHWGLEKKNDKPFIERYINLLGNSTFSLCPRGTGISSVRLFESMAMGSIPVIIADNYQPPLHNSIDWNDISVSISQKDILNIKDKLHSLDTEKMTNKMKEFYNNFLSNDNLHMSVFNYLNEN